MRGLVLEGGGAYGAYQVGVMKAMEEKNIHMDGSVGTSIGSVNSALYVQGGAELAEYMWNLIDISDVFKDKDLIGIMENHTLSYIIEYRDKLINLISSGGIDPKGFYNLLNKYIEEDIIRSSKKDFGLVTFSLDQMKGFYLFKEDMPEGYMTDCILASCYVPAFQRHKILGENFLDGAVADNLPFNMLLKKGYDELYMVRSGGNGIVKDLPKGKNFHEIAPRKKMQNVWDYSHDTIINRINSGYYDFMVYVGEYYGIEYTFDFDIERYKEVFIPDDGKMDRLTNILNLPNMYGKESFYMYVLPEIAKLLKLDYPSSNDVFLSLIEHYLKENDYQEDFLYDESIFEDIKEGKFSKAIGRKRRINELVEIIFD